jgi:Xaa-Pro aminopeptidase
LTRPAQEEQVANVQQPWTEAVPTTSASSTRRIASGGATMAVDWEQRVDFPRLRADRLAKAKAALEASELGALLLFDPNNIRYVTSTHIGEWARDKNARFALLVRGEDPILWDFGSAARHHQLFAPWLPPENFRAGVTPMRGAMPDPTGIPDKLAGRIARELAERDLAGEELGIDMADLVTIRALDRADVHVTDGAVTMLEARKIKTADEIALLDQAAGIVDGVYEEIYRMLRPGVYEHKIVARAQQLLFEMGSEQVEAINAVSGDRCNPHPHVFSDRLLRPGDQAFFDIIHSFMGYRTCYYRTFNVGTVSRSQLDAYRQCREWLDAAIELVRPGATTDEIASVWPTARELGFESEEACFGLQFGHGLGVGLYESPMISRVHSLENPVTIEEGMVFALETYRAATDGKSAARIEEEVVVTADGCELLTRFPAQELLVAGKTYVHGADLLATEEAGGGRDSGDGVLVREPAGIGAGVDLGTA